MDWLVFTVVLATLRRGRHLRGPVQARSLVSRARQTLLDTAGHRLSLGLEHTLPADGGCRKRGLRPMTGVRWRSPCGPCRSVSIPCGRAYSSDFIACGRGAIILVLLWLAVAATIAAFYRHDLIAAALMLPYLVWGSYALALNLSLLRRNA